MHLRPATFDDAEMLWHWRNDPETCANAINTEPVPWDTHVAWLRASFDNPQRQLLIAEADGVPVGIVRVDGNEISWTVAPEARGKGHAKAMVGAAAFPGAEARIKAHNLASQRVAEAAGFRLVVDGALQRWKHGRT